MTTQQIIEMAERVVLARKALAEAEAALEALASGKKAAGRAFTKPRVPHGSVAEAVRAALKGRGPKSFGQIVEAVGGNPVAIRSAVKKERERGHVAFANGLYSWSVVQKNVKARPRLPKAKAAGGSNRALASLPGGVPVGGHGRRRGTRNHPGGAGLPGGAPQQQGGG